MIVSDPCEYSEECQINTPVDCIPNYCGGCYADFYDLDNNLIDCFDDDDDNNDEDFDCSDIDNPEECLELGCDWEYSNNMINGGACFSSENDDDDDNNDEDFDCSDIDNPEECLELGCDWEYSNNMIDGGACFSSENDDDEENEISDCLSDCDDLRFN